MLGQFYNSGNNFEYFSYGGDWLIYIIIQTVVNIIVFCIDLKFTWNIFQYMQLPQPRADKKKKDLVENWNLNYWMQGINAVGYAVANIVGYIMVGDQAHAVIHKEIAISCKNCTKQDAINLASATTSALFFGSIGAVTAVSIVSIGLTWWWKDSYRQWYEREQIIDKNNASA